MRKVVVWIMLMAFITNSFVSPSHAQMLMSKPGEMVALSAAFHPPILSGVKVYADNPFRFDFILDQGDDKGSAPAQDTSRLIKYFLASLTVPEKDLWVNLSPYEKDRIVPDAFGRTEMGRDLLAQDYFLKQLTSSLMFPDGDLGKKFWGQVYQQAQVQFGTTDIPIDTFNKVWITPAKAVVFEKKDMAYVVESRLKVMLESDYMAAAGAGQGAAPTQDLSKDLIRQIIIPALEKEVNEGRNFAQLRQVYHSLILASWYKKKIKESLLSKVYVDQQKVTGVNINDPKEAEKIWAQYVEAFKKGVFDFVKDEKDPVSNEVIPHKYFAGGVNLMKVDYASVNTVDAAALPRDTLIVTAQIDAAQTQIRPRSINEVLASNEWPAYQDRTVSQWVGVIALNDRDEALLKTRQIVMADTIIGHVDLLKGTPYEAKGSVVDWIALRGKY
ncbi:MAG: hypothetical protein HQL17_05740, partial [Candidatus Omnitrophica bacterium]|nr:hypothetical protein [Candidatus Omnitrophota bacterium]